MKHCLRRHHLLTLKLMTYAVLWSPTSTAITSTASVKIERKWCNKIHGEVPPSLMKYNEVMKCRSAAATRWDPFFWLNPAMDPGGWSPGSGPPSYRLKLRPRLYSEAQITHFYTEIKHTFSKYFSLTSLAILFLFSNDIFQLKTLKHHFRPCSAWHHLRSLHGHGVCSSSIYTFLQ